jgi:hypothetical protein
LLRKACESGCCASSTKCDVCCRCSLEAATVESTHRSLVSSFSSLEPTRAECSVRVTVTWAPLRRRAFACLGRMHSLTPLDKRRFCLHSIPNGQALATAVMELVRPPQRESTAGFLSCPARHVRLAQHGRECSTEQVAIVHRWPTLPAVCHLGNLILARLHKMACPNSPAYCLSQNLFADGKLYTDAPVGALTNPVP